MSRGFTLAIIGVTVSSSIAQAQTPRQTARQSTTSTLTPKIRFVQPKLAGNDVTFSGRRKGAASRGQCLAMGEPLTALVPATWKYLGKPQERSDLDAWEVIWGLTTSQSPTLWFFNPYALTNKLPVKFVLESEQGRNIYKTSFMATGTKPGVISFRLPSKAVHLEFGKKYHWYFSIGCDADAPALVEGWVQRVAINPALRSQLQKATTQQRVSLYAANGIWYDALARLAELRVANPKDVMLLNEWISLLDSVGLGTVARQPLRSTLQETTQISEIFPEKRQLKPIAH